MKIAVITTLFPCLSETFILNQITGLLDLGHDVRIFAWSDPHEPVVHPDVAKYDLRARTRYIPRSPRSKTPCLLKAGMLIAANFHKAPKNFTQLMRMYLRRRRGLSLEYVYFLLYFTQENFDVIHCHYGPNGLVGVFLKAAGVTGTVSTVFHGFDVSRYPLTHGKGVYDQLFEHGDLFMPISEYWKAKLVEMGCPREKTVVHRMGIDLSRFEYRERKVPAEGPVRVLTVGRLVEKKGHEYALRAIARLVEDGYDISYTIGGDGPLLDQLRELSVHLGIDNRVIFTGAVTGRDVVKLYQDAQIFLLPSVTAADGDMEGIPVVLMEAMAAGLFVVATRHSGIAEIVLDGRTGLLCDEKDVEAAAAAMRWFHASPEAVKSMCPTARAFVADSYNISLLNEILASRFSYMRGRSL